MSSHLLPSRSHFSRFVTAVVNFFSDLNVLSERDNLVALNGSLYGNEVSATFPSPSTRFRLASGDSSDDLDGAVCILNKEVMRYNTNSYSTYTATSYLLSCWT